MFSSSKISDSIDLHGKSFTEAQQSVSDFIKLSFSQNIPFLRIITGRGNHANFDGSRGLIYKNLVKWLSHNDLSPLIKSIEQRDGSYLVTLNLSQNLLLNNLPQPILRNNSARTHTTETRIGSIVKSLQSLSQKIEAVDALLRLDRNLIYETDNKGNNSLLIAASNNEPELMKFLLQQESILFITPKLLKQKNNEGNTALMIAAEYGHIDTMNYLLTKAPSLLKKRNGQNKSVFHIANKSKDRLKILDYLYQHLSQHKREKGYTGLFHDYMQCIGTSTSPTNRSKAYMKFNKSNAIHKWFFMDRMQKLLEKLKARSGKIHLKTPIFSRFKYRALLTSIKPVVVNLLKQDNKFKKLFLKFNNRLKPAYRTSYKHALNFPILGASHTIIFRKTKVKLKKIKTSKVSSTLIIQKKLTPTETKPKLSSFIKTPKIQNGLKPMVSYASAVKDSSRLSLVAKPVNLTQPIERKTNQNPIKNKKKKKPAPKPK